MKQVLAVAAELDNVHQIKFPLDHEWCFDVQNPTGPDVRERVTISALDQIDTPTNNVSCNFVIKFPDTKVPGRIWLNYNKTTYDEDGQEFQPILTLECRGVEVINWHPTGGYEVAASNGGNKFDDVVLADGEWFDYDQVNKCPISITNLRHRFQKA